MEENITKRTKRKLKDFYDRNKDSIIAWGSIIGLIGISVALGYFVGKSKDDYLKPEDHIEAIKRAEKVGFDGGVDAVKRRIEIGEEVGLINVDESKWEDFWQKVSEYEEEK